MGWNITLPPPKVAGKVGVFCPWEVLGIPHSAWVSMSKEDRQRLIGEIREGKQWQ